MTLLEVIFIFLTKTINSADKIDMILVNKVHKHWSFQKMSITKNVILNWYSSMKKEFRKIQIIFNLENWLCQILALFDSSPLIQNSKFNNLVWVCWFLGKNLSNFVCPNWKLHNLYCHTLQLHQKLQIMHLKVKKK